MNKKWIVSGLVVLAAAGAGIAAYHHYHAADAPAAKLATARVRKGTLAVHVYATGTVQANRTVDIKCLAGGEILKMPFHIGDIVKKGQVVLQVDPTLEQQAVAIAQQDLAQAQLALQTAQLNYRIARENLEIARQTDAANLLSAQAQVANDRLNVQRDLALLQKNVLPQQTYDNDKTTLIQDQQAEKRDQIQIAQLKTQALQVQLQKLNVQSDQVAVESKQASLGQAETNLSYTTVHAPINGVVSNKQVQPGQIIASAVTNVGGGTVVMTLVDLSHIFVNATINESDINHLHRGDFVRVTAPGAPGKVFHGRVESIFPVSIQDQNSNSNSANASATNMVTFEAKIEVLGKEKKWLRPGMTADVDIFADTLHNVLYLPLQAVVVQNGLDTVTVIKPDGDAVTTTVTLGQRNDTDWQVISGLKEGQKVQVHLGGADTMWTPWKH